jgi:VWFA-related protein
MASWNRIIRTLIASSCLWFLTLSPIAASAQTNKSPKYNVRVDIVSIDVEVLDGDGNLVRDLSKDDFLVEENGNAVKIVNFAYQYDNPVSVAIILDTSTIEQKKLSIAKEFILDIIYLLDRGDDICLYSFDNRDAYLEADFTVDRNSLVDAVENIAVSSKRKWGFLAEYFGVDPKTGLCIDLAIYSHRRSKHNKKTLLIISNRFRGLGPATVDHIKSSRCTLYTLGFDNKSAAIATLGGDHINKRQLMSESGGRKFSAETLDVIGVSKTIVNSMKNYYSIAYETEADQEGKKERRIEVKLPGHDYDINSRRTIRE